MKLPRKALMVLVPLLLWACEDEVDRSGPPSPTTANAPSATGTPTHEVAVVGWKPGPPQRSQASVLPREWGPFDAVAAPTLFEAPPTAVVAVLQAGLFAASREGQPDGWVNGDLAVLTASGSWRRVPWVEMGYRGRLDGEVQFAASPDGELLALSDIGSIVVVDVDEGEHSRFPTSTPEPVNMVWSPDGALLSYAGRTSDRHWLLDMRTGESARVGAAASTYVMPTADGGLIEMWAGHRGRPGRARASAAQGVTETLALRLTGDYLADVALTTTRLAVLQGPGALASSPHRPGVLVATLQGQPLAYLLTDATPQSWMSLGGWTDSDTLVVADGDAGQVVLWEVTTGRQESIATTTYPGVIVDIAPIALSDAIGTRQ